MFLEELFDSNIFILVVMKSRSVGRKMRERFKTPVSLKKWILKILEILRKNSLIHCPLDDSQRG